VPIILLKNIELLNTSIYIIAGITLEVNKIMLLKISINVKKVFKSLLITKQLYKLWNSDWHYTIWLKICKYIKKHELILKLKVVTTESSAYK
jgi:hypothetical protein